MRSLTVIVPAHNNEATIWSALQSVVTAVSYLRRQRGHEHDHIEIVVIDDGSRDGTLAAVLDLARGNELFRVFRRESPSSPSAARNCGASLGTGDLLFFLDADDLYLENHIFECCRSFDEPAVHWVKSGVDVSDPVHSEWRGRIHHSLVINLAVRRRCHEFIGGFPDVHLFKRLGDCFEPWIDIFRMIEDVHYNALLGRFFRRADIGVETVRYMRRPGNSFDRQYAKFQRPSGEVGEAPDPDFDFRVQLSKLIMEHQCRLLNQKNLEGNARKNNG
jgi:glycosyltransferase involved in cell wall biosynthesis